MAEKDRNKVVYVIGAYRAPDEITLFGNIMRARRVAEELWVRGYIPLCPHLNSAFMGGLVPDKRFLEGGIILLERCDAFAVVDGFENSEGSRAEIEHALAIGKEFVPTRAGVADLHYIQSVINMGACGNG